MALLDPKERTQRGIDRQTELTGKPAPQAATLYEESWRDFIYSEVWTRPGLDRRARFLISIAGAGNGDAPSHILENYIRGALTLKDLTLAELREAALHHSVYSGWMRGGIVDAAITRVANELGLAPAKTPAIRAEPWDPAERTKFGQAGFDKVMTFPGGPPSTPYTDGGIFNFVFGEMWMRPGLDERSRRWITLVGVANSSSEIPIKSHIYSAMKSGNASLPEMYEFVLQYAIHAGWPKGSVINGIVGAMAARIEQGLSFQ